MEQLPVPLRVEEQITINHVYITLIFAMLISVRMIYQPLTRKPQEASAEIMVINSYSYPIC